MRLPMDMQEAMLIRDANYPVVIASGDMYLEVRLKGVNKGECLLSIVDHLAANNGLPDFCLCIGNDDHDECEYNSMLHQHVR